jgi:hypothetical protein
MGRQIEGEAFGYRTRRGGLMDGRYVIAKLGSMRKEREWLVQATSDDRIIVQGNYNADGRTECSKGAIGCFKVDGSGGRLTTQGGYFPHLGFAKPFEFPTDFVKACLEVSHALDAVTDSGVVIVHQTVQVIG